jgi:hypothetical protein
MAWRASKSRAASEGFPENATFSHPQSSVKLAMANGDTNVLRMKIPRFPERSVEGAKASTELCDGNTSAEANNGWKRKTELAILMVSMVYNGRDLVEDNVKRFLNE